MTEWSEPLNIEKNSLSTPRNKGSSDDCALHAAQLLPQETAATCSTQVSQTEVVVPDAAENTTNNPSPAQVLDNPFLDRFQDLDDDSCG